MTLFKDMSRGNLYFTSSDYLVTFGTINTLMILYPSINIHVAANNKVYIAFIEIISIFGELEMKTYVHSNDYIGFK